MEVLLLLVSFAVVLAGALIFTNAVEWIGHKLEVGVGAVGSILAAVGTAMPETLIAIVALVDVSEGSEDVAVGAIVGAPFLLATLAMGLVGLFSYLYRDKRDQGVQLNVHRPTLERDLVFFLVLFTLAGLLAWGPPAEVRVPVGLAFLLAYVFYIRLTLRWRSASSSSWSGWGRWSAAPTSSSRSCCTSPRASASRPWSWP